MIYFKTRAQARNFAKGTKKVIDLSKGSPRDLFKAQAGFSKRWAVKAV